MKIKKTESKTVVKFNETEISDIQKIFSRLEGKEIFDKSEFSLREKKTAKLFLRLIAENQPKAEITETVFDFKDGQGPVPAHRHINPDEFEGGWVANTARVGRKVWVAANARVYGQARVSGNARVTGNAEVSDTAWVCGNAQVSGNARVFNNAQVKGMASIKGGSCYTRTSVILG